MDEAKERGKAPPTGEGVVLLQSTYRHPVQTTLVPHTNVCTYVCGYTRVFPVRAFDPSAPPLLSCRRRLLPLPRRRRASTYNSHDGPTHARVKTSRCVFRR